MLAIIFEAVLALSSVLTLQRTIFGIGSIVVGNVILTMRPVEIIRALAFLIDVSGWEGRNESGQVRANV